MDPILRQNIIDELRKFLKREPSEREIMNGQNDVNIMSKILQEKINKQELDIIILKKKK